MSKFLHARENGALQSSEGKKRFSSSIPVLSWTLWWPWDDILAYLEQVFLLSVSHMKSSKIGDWIVPILLHGVFKSHDMKKSCVILNTPTIRSGCLWFVYLSLPPGKTESPIPRAGERKDANQRPLEATWIKDQQKLEWNLDLKEWRRETYLHLALLTSSVS